MDTARMAWIGGAAFAGGLVNAIAGGGSLISFPALVAAGLPSVTASLTNTVALCPGYIGGTWAQKRDLAGQRARLILLVPASAIGGVLGALLLLATGESAFEIVVPFLLLVAVGLLTFQDRLHKFLRARRHKLHPTWIVLPVGVAAIYGGYFGAALGVIVLAVLDVMVDDSLVRLNALKQSLSLSTNVSAAVVFLFSKRIDWAITGVMAVAALLGGAGGGAIASRVPPKLLRAVVLAVGLGMAIYYFARL